MVTLKIDGLSVTVSEGTTILAAARKAGIPIPTLCHLEGINEIGACRVCVVEIAGQDKLCASCNNLALEGMEVYTNSRVVRQARRTTVELLLSQHDCQCTYCIRSGNCSLQELANDLGVLSLPYEKEVETVPWNPDLPLIKDAGKCIKCMRCVQICDKVQQMKVWDISGTGFHTTVGVTGNRAIADTDCTMCGQCVTHCPVGALHERDDTARAFAALADPNTITVVQIAPAAQAAWGESLGLTRDEATVGRLTAALRRMGFDYIFDTGFAADLTIMEEGSELLQRLQDGKAHQYPMFTSCCPGWVRYLKSQYPDMAVELSTAKSPQQMFGAIAKTYFAKHKGIAPERVYCVSIMPCLAKKYEQSVEVLNSGGAGADVDLVLTTREIDRMIRAEHILAGNLPEEAFDQLLGRGSGAGLIFGASGGVMEAALRSAGFLATGVNSPEDAFKQVRGRDGWREAEFEIAGIAVNVAVASGLSNAHKLVEALRRKEASYDFVEIMACPGGCSGGGGQPIHDGIELAEARSSSLYHVDRQSALRYSHENPDIIRLYDDFLDSPLSETAHELLHTDHANWKLNIWSD